MKTATAYIRVSTESQVSDGVSLDAQQAKIAAWCLVNDMVLGQVFVDAGISGKREDNRPQHLIPFVRMAVFWLSIRSHD